MKKTVDKQKSDIKRLTKDNDSLRREISRYNGMRKNTGDSDIVGSANKLVADVSNAHNEFRDKITGIASMLIDALDSCTDEDSEFMSVINRRGKSQSKVATTYSQVVASGQTKPPADTNIFRQSIQPLATHRRRPSCPTSSPPPSPNNSSRDHDSTSSQKRGHAIPVVQLGIGRQHTSSKPPVQPAANQRQCPQAVVRSDSRPSQRSSTSGGTLIIGTSLIAGLGQNLSKVGVPATAYMYRGATVPVLQNRVKHILDSSNQPSKIVIQCGGNDAKRQLADVVSARIETLVHDIKPLSPSSDIIINKVPPRGNNKKVITNIQRLNSCLDQRFHADDRVHIVDVCPKSCHFYRDDLVHFNSKGSFMFAEQLADKLSNFYLLDKKMWI